MNMDRARRREDGGAWDQRGVCDDVNLRDEGLAATTAMSRPLTVAELRDALAALSLDSRGNKDTLRKRLARATRSLSRSSSPARPLAREQQTRPPDQLFDSFLVFDVEATCEEIEGPWGKLAFAYPNEIIEWPVILLQWRKKRRRDERDLAPGEEVEGEDEDDWELVQTAEFHSFVKPTWRRTLSAFCTALTGITQRDVDSAPTFSQLCRNFHRDFILKHNLFTSENKTVWVTDGPWDLRDFVAKTCYLSGTPRPPWLAGEMIDLRLLVSSFFAGLKKDSTESSRLEGKLSDAFGALSVDEEDPQTDAADLKAALGAQPLPTPIAGPLSGSSAIHIPSASTSHDPPSPAYLPSHQLTAPSSLSLPSVLDSLTLPPFSGRLHSGLSDARNASRILIDLAHRGLATSVANLFARNSVFVGTVFTGEFSPLSCPERALTS
ncbi:Double-strand siRNA ribonuclease [Rhodotorula toruloides ATCC 204091]|uniref:Double-strand siRNA ribonuclease n=1 Tax=Rhodotorula toruloides TaxID=5286 RepID=A0A0K3CH02_RHOTO|nr:Double-strand siRNA ribonuclease [Rhodotorula toruloides ATCC 204091]PRQ73665.1 double-strand siRNA ribonuclease [Rhodotorula toruloides]